MSEIYIYNLSHGDYDGSSDNIFTSKHKISEQHWNYLCCSLIEDAVKYMMSGSVRNNWIGWGDITRYVSFKLKEKGFNAIRPTLCCFNGTSIISKYHEDSEPPLSGEQRALIIKHNNKVRRNLRITMKNYK